MAQISQANFKRRLALALALPLLLMSILAVSLIGQVSHLTSVMQWVDHTDRVIAQANYTQKLLVDMETGLRGYLVTGNSEFLQPYQQASLAIAPAFDQLGRMTSDNPLQVQRLSKLRSQYEQWNRYAQQMMALKKQGGNYQAYAINAQGKTQMDTMRGEMASFIQTEEALRNNRTQTAQKTTQLLFVSRTVLSLGVGGIMAFFIRRQLIAVAQSYARALAVAQEQTETLRESEAALRRSAQRLADLHQIDRSILQAQSLEVLIHAALSRLRKLVPYQQAFVVLFNFETATAQVVARIGNGESNLPEGTTMPIEDFVPSEVLQQITHDLENVPVFESCPPIVERLADGESRSCLTVPLRVEDSLMGEISFIANQVAGFAPENQQIIQEVAAQLAIAIQQSKLREQLQNYAAELEQRVADRTEKLQEVNAELEAFSYSVSHDLRAPLRTLQGFTQALLEDYGDQLDPIGQDYTRYIAQAAVSMDTLISDLLAYSRLSRADIQIQPIDLSTVMAEVLRQLDVELRELQALVTVEESLPQVMAHRRTLVQVLTNLLTNAIKFVKPEVQPQLRVWAEERGSRESELGNGDRTDDSPLPTPHSLPNWVRLWVEDNGIGIAPEYQDRIFRVFERLHGVETYPGTGIGLAIVRKGIERMGGRVGVVSQPDKGSRFWIELPKASR
jgi:signal transduction histidine kinase/CHASE3 domain sensor protein